MQPAAVLRGEQVERVTARPVAKIAVSASTMLRIALAIENNMTRFVESSEPEMEQAEADHGAGSSNPDGSN